MLSIVNLDKEKIYEELKQLRYGVFEGIDDYYMIHIDMVARVPDYILQRYKSAESINDEEEKEKRLNKVRSLIKYEYLENRQLKWISIKEFISNLENKRNNT